VFFHSDLLFSCDCRTHEFFAVPISLGHKFSRRPGIADAAGSGGGRCGGEPGAVPAGEPGSQLAGRHGQ